MKRCSFCGIGDDERALLQGQEAEQGTAFICAECASSCARALQAESEITHARASEAPAAKPGRRRSGAPVAWSEFEYEGRRMQWQAEEGLEAFGGPATLLRVRPRARGTVATIDVAVADDVGLEHAHACARLLRQLREEGDGGSEQNDERAEWKPFELDGEAYEYTSALSVYGTLHRLVKVEVKDQESGTTRVSKFPSNAEVSVDDAVFVAAQFFDDEQGFADEQREPDQAR